MATSHYRPLLGAVEAAGVDIYKKRRAQGIVIHSHVPTRSQRSALKFLTHATQSSEPTSPQAKQREDKDSNVPSWAQPGSSEPPPWERKQAASVEPTAFEIPFYAYLLASVVVAIAAIGSIFEYFNKKPVFGVISPDNPLYAPILGVFVFTGFPLAAFLWLKSIKLANKVARDQDREDGFLD